MMWPFKKKAKTILVFPKGTVVRFNGIPCELLQDTPYESAHFRAISQSRKAEVESLRKVRGE